MDLPSRPSVLPEDMKNALLLPNDNECESSPDCAQAAQKRRYHTTSRRFAQDGRLAAVPLKPKVLSRMESLAGFLCGLMRKECGCVHYHAFVLPLVFFSSFILLGCLENCSGEDGCPRPRSWFNVLLVTIGPLLPLLVLGLRVAVLPFGKMETVLTLLVWLCISVLRLLLYFEFMGRSGLFSDHIFLMASILAMLQTEIAYTHRYITQCRVWALPPLLAEYILIWLICDEAYTTAHYYHSVSQSLLGMLLGELLFGPIAWCWLQYRLHHMNTDYGSPKSSAEKVDKQAQDNGKEDPERGTYKAPSPVRGDAEEADDHLKDHLLRDKLEAVRNMQAIEYGHPEDQFHDEEDPLDEDEAEEADELDHAREQEPLPPIRAKPDDLERRRRQGPLASDEVSRSRTNPLSGATGQPVVQWEYSFGSPAGSQAEPPLPPPSVGPTPIGRLSPPQEEPHSEFPPQASSSSWVRPPAPPSASSAGVPVATEIAPLTASANGVAAPFPSMASGDAAAASSWEPVPASSAAAPAADPSAPAAVEPARKPPAQTAQPPQAAQPPQEQASPGRETLPVFSAGRPQEKKAAQPSCCAFIPGCKRTSGDEEDDGRPRSRSNFSDF